MNTPNTNRSNDREAGDMNYREEWLSAYLDDELSPAQRAVVEQRIAVDAEATLMLQDLERIRGLVGSLPAWRGRDLQVPLTELLPDDNASDIPTAAIATRPDGDFHDELQPQPASSSAAGAGTRDQARASRRSTAGSFGRPGNRWLRPVALAASLLFVLGAGLLIWPEAAPWSVAISTRISDPADQPKASAPPLSEPTNQTQESTSAFGAGSLQEAADATETLNEPSAAPSLQLKLPEAGQTFNYSADRQGVDKPLLPPATAPTGGAADPKLDTLRRGAGQGVGDPSNALLAPPPAAAAESLSSSREEKRNSQGGAAFDGAAQPKLPAAESSPSGGAVAMPAPIQLAHSAAWNEAEIGVGLLRLAPLLYISPAVQASAAKDQLPPRERSEVAFRGAVEFEIPVAVAPRQPAEDSGSHLLELLQQSGFALVGVTADNSIPSLPGLAPFGATTPEVPATIALFVDRGQAEQILQAAKQAGEISANPVWIRSASTRDVPLDNQQKVIVLFAPQ